MKRKGNLLPLLAAFMTGVVLGFLLAPIKKGIESSCNNGNTNNYYYGIKPDREEAK